MGENSRLIKFAPTELEKLSALVGRDKWQGGLWKKKCQIDKGSRNAATSGENDQPSN